jgi:demethylmenaquinone methyltransferase / 2-methoxy-6-polyprenyl-1,4-benzoquinol methylase
MVPVMSDTPPHPTASVPGPVSGSEGEWFGFKPVDPDAKSGLVRAGDIAFRFLNRGGGAAIVCDITEAMVRVGRDRAIDRNILSGVNWTVGDAEKLPIASRSVDAYTIAFGLRNVTRIDAALTEARRVLRPGGKFYCLEFSHVVLPVLRELYDLYSFQVLPKIGRIVAKDEDSYRYLAESIRRFPAQEDLARRIAAAGFGAVRVRNLTGGIAAIHSGWRI